MGHEQVNGVRGGGDVVFFFIRPGMRTFRLMEASYFRFDCIFFSHKTFGKGEGKSGETGSTIL